MPIRLTIVLWLGLAGASMGARAAQEVARIPIVDAPAGTPSLGAGFRLGSSPYVGEADENSADLVPLYLYEGKYVFAHGTSGGVHIFRNELFSFDALLQYRFQRLDPGDVPERAGLREREQTLDGGVQAGLNTRWGTLSANWLTDTMDRHGGQEVNLSYRYNFDFAHWSISPFLNWSWQDADLVNYYFGVSPEEATADRPAYSPGSAKGFGFGLNASYRLADNILVFGNIGFQGLDSPARNSPIVEESSISTAFLGASYLFGNVRRGPGEHGERAGEWSWRVNYGYQAQGNIVGDIDRGDFSKSNKADTHIAGLTLGKLLNAGRKVDFYGKVSINRHLEGSLQDDFFSYMAYIMAIGKGYLPWSDRPAFRWGFGFGASYAQEVPIVEQIKQAEKEGNTNKFLNYLEMTVDFPLDRMLKSDSLHKCYLGLTTVHRSGIFSTSDILGNVAGGSDWLTVHLECLR